MNWIELTFETTEVSMEAASGPFFMQLLQHPGNVKSIELKELEDHVKDITAVELAIEEFVSEPPDARGTARINKPFQRFFWLEKRILLLVGNRFSRSLRFFLMSPGALKKRQKELFGTWPELEKYYQSFVNDATAVV